MKAFWLKYRLVIISGAVAAGFGYAAFRISPLACGLLVGALACVGVAAKLFPSKSA
jgi:hypothetical protein